MQCSIFISKVFQQFKNWHLNNEILPGDFQVKCQLWNIEWNTSEKTEKKWLSNTKTDSESLQAFNINNEDEEEEEEKEVQ